MGLSIHGAGQVLSNTFKGITNLVTTGKWGDKNVTQNPSDQKSDISQYQKPLISNDTNSKRFFIQKSLATDLTKTSEVTIGNRPMQKAVSNYEKRNRKTSATLGQHRAKNKLPSGREQLARTTDTKRLLDNTSTMFSKELRKSGRNVSRTLRDVAKAERHLINRHERKNLFINLSAAKYLRISGLKDESGECIIPRDAKILSGDKEQGVAGKSLLRKTSNNFSDAVEDAEINDDEIEARENSMVSNLKIDILKSKAAELKAQGKTEEEIETHLASLPDDILTAEARGLLNNIIEDRVAQALSDPKVMAEIEDLIVRPEELE